jgi:GNAT superfamily N-acetyltransferase
MFGLQPPRHISTLPSSAMRRIVSHRLQSVESCHPADMDRGVKRAVQTADVASHATRPQRARPTARQQPLHPIDYCAHAGGAAQIAVNDDPVLGHDFGDRWGQPLEQRMAVADSDGLRAYYLSQTGYYDFRPLAVFVRDPQTGKIIGGLHGRSEFGLVYVAWFFLPEDWRGARIGSRVLAMAEEEGRRRGCTRIALTTLSIEAPGFYQKQGYNVAATIDCEPPGLTRYYMMKRL